MTRAEQKPLYESPLWQSFNEGLRRPGGLELTDYAVNLCRMPAASRMLDIGCGGGVSVEYLHSRFGIDAEGLDRSEVMIEEARKMFPERCFIHADSAAIPLADSSFQGVLAECSLSLCRNLSEVLTEVRRVLISGGFLIVTDMYEKRGCYYNHNGVSNSCLQKLRPEHLWLESLVKAGFEIRHWEDRSSDLASLTARIIFEFGSLENFYSQWTGSSCTGLSCRYTKTEGKPGYFLCLAQKKEEG